MPGDMGFDERAIAFKQFWLVAALGDEEAPENGFYAGFITAFCLPCPLFMQLPLVDEGGKL